MSRIDLVSENYFHKSKEIFLNSKNGCVEIIEKDSKLVLNHFNVAFPIIHGDFGEDGTLQGVLKSFYIPFVGPDILGSAICMDKDVTKRLLRDVGIPIADFLVIKKYNQNNISFEDVTKKLGLPLFVKPANAGSSVGVSKVTDEKSYKNALNEAFRFDNKILIEEAIIGKEIECAILGNEYPKASVLGEIIPTKDFYSYDAKYLSSNGSTTRIPASLDDNISNKLRNIAVKAFETTCCEGMARVDFFLKDDNTFVLNEINTLPGFTDISMYPQLWEKTGIPYKNLISDLIELALKRYNRDNEIQTEK